MCGEEEGERLGRQMPQEAMPRHLLVVPQGVVRVEGADEEEEAVVGGEASGSGTTATRTTMSVYEASTTSFI